MMVHQIGNMTSFMKFKIIEMRKCLKIIEKHLWSKIMKTLKLQTLFCFLNYFDPHLERPQMVKQAFLALPFSGVQLEWAQVTVVVLVLPLGNLYLML